MVTSSTVTEVYAIARFSTGAARARFARMAGIATNAALIFILGFLYFWRIVKEGVAEVDSDETEGYSTDLN